MERLDPIWTKNARQPTEWGKCPQEGLSGAWECLKLSIDDVIAFTIVVLQSEAAVKVLVYEEIAGPFV